MSIAHLSFVCGMGKVRQSGEPFHQMILFHQMLHDKTPKIFSSATTLARGWYIKCLSELTTLGNVLSYRET